MQPIEIERLDDPRVADYRDVKDAALRRDRAAFIIEGALNLEVMLDRSPLPLTSVFVTPVVLDRLRERSEQLGATPVYVAERAVYDEIAGFHVHRGCLAIGHRSVDPSLETLTASAAPQLWIALEGLTNDENVGVVFRNAMAFGATGVLLSPGCADPLYRKAIRVSMGGTLCVPTIRCREWPAPLEALRKAGFTVVALHPGEGARDIRELEPAAVPDRLVLVLGTEGPGIEAGTLEGVDWRLRIDMAAGIDSLNVGTACGIALHHLSTRVLGAGAR